MTHIYDTRVSIGKSDRSQYLTWKFEGRYWRCLGTRWRRWL